MFVKPAPGLKVRDPLSRLHLPDEGKEVPEDSFWMRRLRSGDVVRVEPQQQAAAKAKGEKI